MTMYWAPLLHIYQPPTQDLDILRKINEECYKPLFRMIEEYDNAKICLNINGVLVDLFYEFGLGETMNLLKNLVSENKIEIVGTAKYHPILPLIPRKEIYRQIKMNEEINQKEFGNSWVRKGFFPPEMAISSTVAKIVREIGYKWVIMSGIACPVDWSYDKIYLSPNGIQLYFRDDILSNKIAFKSITAKEFVDTLKTMFLPLKKEEKQDNVKNKDRYIVTAMDGETFGHHIKNYEKTFLGKALELIQKEDNVKTVFISELDRFFPLSEKKIVPRDSSWSTSYEDILAENPYPLWKHPENTIHKYYWKIVHSLNNLMQLLSNLDLNENWEVKNYYNTARWFFDRGLHSCPLWWASYHRDIWNPNLIYKGLELLLKSALNAQLALVQAGRDDGDGYFDSISYYHGLLLMEIYTITKKNVKKEKEKKK